MTSHEGENEKRGFRRKAARRIGAHCEAVRLCLSLGRIWWPEAARLEDPLDISNGMLALKSSGECDGILSLV